MKKSTQNSLKVRTYHPLSFCISVIAMTLYLFPMMLWSRDKGGICPQPDSPCASQDYSFEPYELSFSLPQKLKWQTNYDSADFYAVILKSRPAVLTDEDCRMDHCQGCSEGFFPEDIRVNLQNQFPKRKVFASRFGCSTEQVWYEEEGKELGKINFVAVYAGRTLAEAKTFLKEARSKGYQDAYLKKLKVVLGFGD